MKEIAVQFASRYIKRKQSDAVGKNLLKTLTEPITNSDDSYGEIVKSEPGSENTLFPITIFIDKKKRLVRITDHAQGMSGDELEAKFKEYGGAKSSAYKGGNSRGIFGQGISDVLFYHRDGKIKSMKNGESSICSFYWKKDKQYINVEKQKDSSAKIAKEWGISNERGTVVEFIVDNTTIHDYDNIIKKLSVFYMLRLINANDKRVVKLIYKDTKGTKESIIKYEFPKGELVEHKEFTFQFESYDPVIVDVDLYRSTTSLQTIGDERENGLLVHDNKEAVYAQTFFGWDNLPGADKFFGFMKLTGAREIILAKINDQKHPEAILSDSRDGFNTQHDFYKRLSSEVRDWLYPILNEERRKKTNDGVSESTIEKHRKAFEELNKLYAQLTGEDISGIIRTKKKTRPVGGIEFARNNITITAGKHYGLQLIIDTRVIKPDTKISLKSSKNLIGFSPVEIEVSKAKEGDEDIIIKTIIITGTEARTADTLEAKSGNRSASVVVSIVSEEVVYPEKGIIFSPDYTRAIVNQDSTLHLYVDLGTIKSGNKIAFSSSNNFIELKKSRIAVPKRMRSTSKVAKIEVSFVGRKNDESGIIEASFGEYSTQCRVDIKDRIKISPTGPTGKFKDWDFDDGVPKQMQTTFDSIQGSPTQGYILINSNHPINKYYFGDKPEKKNMEESHIAQLYLAELILNESLGAMIPEAYQKGVIARNYGPEYDIPVYIAQKKFEIGPTIYDFFVEESSITEVKREKQIEELKQGGILLDEGLVDSLDDRQQQMVEMRFGLGDQRPHTLTEIGIKFNITRERVRQIIDKVLAKNRGEEESEELDTTTTQHDFIKEEENKIENKIENIKIAVSNYFRLNKGELMEKTRRAPVVEPRQIAIYLVKELVGLSYSSIARIFNFDHTTVLYAFNKISKDILSDKELLKKVNSIKEILVKNDILQPIEFPTKKLLENSSEKEEKVWVSSSSKTPEITADMEFLKTRVENLDLSENIINLLSSAGIRTIRGLVEGTLFNIREEVLLAIPGMDIKKIEKIISAVEKLRGPKE